MDSMITQSESGLVTVVSGHTERKKVTTIKQDSFGNVLRAFFKRRGVDPNEKKTSTCNFCINNTRNGKLSICSNNIIFPIPRSSVELTILQTRNRHFSGLYTIHDYIKKYTIWQ